LVPASGNDAVKLERTVGLAESNGSLLPGLTYLTSGLSA